MIFGRLSRRNWYITEGDELTSVPEEILNYPPESAEIISSLLQQVKDEATEILNITAAGIPYGLDSIGDCHHFDAIFYANVTSIKYDWYIRHFINIGRLAYCLNTCIGLKVSA